MFDTDFSTELCSGLRKPVHKGLVAKVRQQAGKNPCEEPQQSKRRDYYFELFSMYQVFNSLI